MTHGGGGMGGGHALRPREPGRQYDNGNRFRIAPFPTQAEADAEQRRAPGHGQAYRVERRDGAEDV